jgi:hypothetical protein
MVQMQHLCLNKQLRCNLRHAACLSICIMFWVFACRSEFASNVIALPVNTATAQIIYVPVKFVLSLLLSIKLLVYE